MKKVLFFAALLSVALISCDKDDDPVNTDDPNKEVIDKDVTPEEIQESIVGKWQITGLTTVLDGKTTDEFANFEDGDKDDVFEFTDDFKYFIYSSPDDSKDVSKATYVIENNVLKIDFDGYIVTNIIKSLTANQLKTEVTYSGEEGVSTFIYKRL